MADLGSASLLLALVLSLYGASAYWLGASRAKSELVESGRNASLVVLALLALASGLLLRALLAHDFRLAYVYDYSCIEMAPLFLISAFWAGQAGSLLLWASTLSGLTATFWLLNRKEAHVTSPYVLSLLSVVEAFFLFLLCFAASPFDLRPTVAQNGLGLNPLLENLGMLFHPPALYLGYVGYAVPWALVMAALLTGRLDGALLRSIRLWSLFAWFFLSMGNLLGAQWAYVELGWGGYWGWDPVENASLIPWLTGTAFLHSTTVQVRRGIMGGWTASLAIATFLLTIFGTAVTRSGLLSSVHAFGDSYLGVYFVIFLSISTVWSLALLVRQRHVVSSGREIASLLSREAWYLLAVLILLGSAFATFWGTVFPAVSQAVRGYSVVLGPDFFNRVNIPILLALLAALGVCPLLSWKTGSPVVLAKSASLPLAAAILVALILRLSASPGPTVLLASAICTFAAAATLRVVVRPILGGGGKSQWLRRFWQDVARSGGYLVHLGVLILAVGVAFSSGQKLEQEVTLARGERASIGSYSVVFDGLESSEVADGTVVTASLGIFEQGKLIDRMSSEKFFHRSFSSPVTDVGIRSTLRDDLYIVLEDWKNADSATFKLMVSPLIMWIWIGGIVLLAGTALAIWPRRAIPTVDSPRVAVDKSATDQDAGL